MSRIDEVIERYLGEAKVPDLKEGDKVRFARAFLKSIKASPTDPEWKMTGVVKSVGKVGSNLHVKVEWNNDETKGALASNLEKIKQ